MPKNAIVVYSKTGHTLEVAKRIQVKNNAEILAIEATSDDPNQKIVELIETPDIIGFDHIILGSPVHGFRVSKIMEAYLKQLPELMGKTFDLYVTQFFPFAFLGANQAFKQMKKLIEQKDGAVRLMKRVSFGSRKREMQILDLIRSFDD